MEFVRSAAKSYRQLDPVLQRRVQADLLELDAMGPSGAGGGERLAEFCELVGEGVRGVTKGSLHGHPWGAALAPHSWTPLECRWPLAAAIPMSGLKHFYLFLTLVAVA